MARGEIPLGGNREATEKFVEAFTVDSEVGSLANADIVPWGTFDARQVPCPVMRIGIGDDAETGTLQ